MNCHTSVWIDYYYDLPAEEAIARLQKAGFAFGELSDIHMEQLMARGDPQKVGSDLKAYIDSLGYSIPQAHLSYCRGLIGEDALERLKAELDMLAALGVGNAVLHVAGGVEMEAAARYAAWVENLRRLSDFVEGSGIVLCLENLMTVEPTRTAHSLLQLIQDSGGKNMGICLDTGHLHVCNCRGLANQTQGEFIRVAGDKLRALHINDNNGQLDTHQMPFSARYGVDWADVMRGLRDVGYQGLFNLEIVGEWGGSDEIKAAKLAFVQTVCREMLSEGLL